MRSNVVKIHKGTADLPTILRECEKVAVYNDLDRKQGLHLRLLCEELDGMLPTLIGDFQGELCIFFEDGVCKVVASIQIDELTSERREELISVAKSKKNAAAVGVVGKIRSAVECLFLDVDFTEAFQVPLGGVEGVPFHHLDSIYTDYWSLRQYRQSVEDATEAWDELEKSVIASVADDVIVAVKGNRAEIVIVKNF